MTEYYVYKNPKGVVFIYSKKPSDWSRLIGTKAVYTVSTGGATLTPLAKARVESAIAEDMRGRKEAAERLLKKAEEAQSRYVSTGVKGVSGGGVRSDIEKPTTQQLPTKESPEWERFQRSFEARILSKVPGQEMSIAEPGPFDIIEEKIKFRRWLEETPEATQKVRTEALGQQISAPSMGTLQRTVTTEEMMKPKGLSSLAPEPGERIEQRFFKGFMVGALSPFIISKRVVEKYEELEPKLKEKPIETIGGILYKIPRKTVEYGQELVEQTVKYPVYSLGMFVAPSPFDLVPIRIPLPKSLVKVASKIPRPKLVKELVKPARTTHVRAHWRTIGGKKFFVKGHYRTLSPAVYKTKFILEKVPTKYEVTYLHGIGLFKRTKFEFKPKEIKTTITVGNIPVTSKKIIKAFKEPKVSEYIEVSKIGTIKALEYGIKENKLFVEGGALDVYIPVKRPKVKITRFVPEKRLPQKPFEYWEPKAKSPVALKRAELFARGPQPRTLTKLSEKEIEKMLELERPIRIGARPLYKTHLDLELSYLPKPKLVEHLLQPPKIGFEPKIGQVQIPEFKFESKVKRKPVVSLRQEIYPSVTFFPSIGFRQETKIEPKFRPKQAIKMRTRQEELVKTRFAPKIEIKSLIPKITISVPFKPDFLGKKEPFSIGETGIFMPKRGYKYTPSLLGIFKFIKPSSKVPKTLMGLRPRPIVRSWKRK